jgi:putative NADH-flavin reductase
MKLVVAGATGFVGGEVLRLALRNKSITSVVALARKEVPVPKHAGSEADISKLKSVLLEDWEGPYPDLVIEQLKGADACVWSVLLHSHAWSLSMLMLRQDPCSHAHKVQRCELRRGDQDLLQLHRQRPQQHSSRG